MLKLYIIITIQIFSINFNIGYAKLERIGYECKYWVNKSPDNKKMENHRIIKYIK